MSDLWCFDVHGGIGKAALYKVSDTNPTDDAPLTTPRSNLSRVRFHTDFKYPKIISDTQYSVTLPARTKNTSGEQTHTLGAHGRGGIPFCFGAVLYNGNWSPLFISTPIYYSPSGGRLTYIARMLSLGANSTNLLLHEYYVMSNLSGSSGTPVGSQTITVRVLVTDELLT